MHVTLPPEILDKILEHIPTSREGRPTLNACALVATWWIGPSQRRLFSSVSIYNENHQQWIDDVILSRSKTLLLQCAHSLRHHRSLGEGAMYPIQDLPGDSGEYLSALQNIRNLELVHIRIERLSQAEFDTCFSAFRGTLTNLTLWNFTASFDAFLTLVDYFPNIVTLRLSPSGLEPDEGPVLPLSRPLRGKLHVSYATQNCLGLIDRFAMLDLEYAELVVDSISGAPTEFLGRILRLSPDTVEYLRLTIPFRCEYPYHASRVSIQPLASDGTTTTIHHFRQLRELEMMITWPSSACKTLSSITSTELRKIIFPVRYIHEWNVFTGKMEIHTPIDQQLCELVAQLGRSGYRHTLEVELRLAGTMFGLTDHDFTTLLPEFRKTGVVNIINVDAVRGDWDLH